MKRTLDKMKALIEFFANRKHLRTLTVTLAAIVVFVTTYVLILPAFTLEQDEAAKMGGIDVTVEQSVDEAEGIDLKDDVLDKTVKDDAVPAPPEEAGAGQQTAYLDNATLEFEGDGYAVSAKVDEDARLPEDTKLSAEELGKGTKDFEYDKYYDDALAALQKESGDVSDISFVRFYDISLMSGGEAVKPEAPVSVSIAYDEAVKTGDAEDIRIIEFAEDEKTGETEAVLLDDKENNVETTVKKDELKETSFDAEDASIYAVVGTKTETIEKEVITAKGETYTITAEYDPEATGIPAGADLKVNEITGDDADPYAVAAANKLNCTLNDFSFSRFFDIKIVDESGKEYHDLGDAVQISIHYKSAVELEEGQELSVVHFKDGVDKAPELIDADLSKDGKEIAFEQNGFSVTGTVVTGTVSSGYYVLMAKGSDGKYYALSHYAAAGGTDGTAGGNDSGVYSREIKVEETTTTDEEGNEIVTGRKVNDPNAIKDDVVWYYNSSPSSKKIYYYNTNYQFDWDSSNGGRFQNSTEYHYLVYYYAKLEVFSKSEWGDAFKTELTGQDQWNVTSSHHLSNVAKEYEITFDNTTKQFRYTTTSGSGTEIFFVSVESQPATKWATPKVHYVDNNGNPLTVTHGRDWTTTNISKANVTPEYLRYDIEGYEYVETRINSLTGTKIKPIIQYGGPNSGTWQYTTYTSPETSNGSANGQSTYFYMTWNDLGDKDVYVIYKKATEPPEGGVPKPIETSTGDLADPVIHKGSTDNGNGTNTLSLDITADTVQQEVYELADVIVILDLSSSMSRNMGNDNEANPASNARFATSKRVLLNLANTLIGPETDFQVTDSNGVTHKQIRMSLITFAHKATVRQFAASGGGTETFTEDYEAFKKVVAGADDDPNDNGQLSLGVGTNWEDALDKANKLAVDEDRATFVIFVTDGNPSYHISRGNLLNYDMSEYFGSNTPLSYWELVTGRETDVHKGNYWFRYRDQGLFGTQDEHDPRNYYPAIDDAQSIVSHNKNLYAIGIGMPTFVDRLRRLMGYAYTGTDVADQTHTTVAGSEEELKQAFEDIVLEISALKGFGGISMYDGLTDFSSTVMEKSNGGSNDFQYWKADAPDNWDSMTVAEKEAYLENVRINGRPEGDFEPWDPASERCEEASYDAATGAVKWDMGNRFVPQAGCTYRVTFKIWPNQDAYDLISDLNNGVVQYSELDPSIKNQINEEEDPVTHEKTYTMNTNRPDAYVDYHTAEKTATTVAVDDESTRLDFNSVPAMPLTETTMGIIKHWNDSAYQSNRPGHIYLGVLRDGQGIYIDTLPSDAVEQFSDGVSENIWYSASHGCYYYKTTVSGVTKYQYVVKLSADDWRADTFISPGLKVNGEVLEPGHNYTFHELPDDYHYELVGDPVHPMLIDSASEIYDLATGDVLVNFEVTNDLRGGIEVKKLVYDTAGNDISAQEGVKDTEFTYTVTKLETPDGSDVWYSKFEADGTQIDLAPSDPDEKSAIIAEGDTFTLKPGQYIRLVNVPIGTKFEFTETDPTDLGYELYSITQSENGTETITDIIKETEKITANKGTTKANTNYAIVFVNRPNFEVEVEKVDASDSTKKLAGVDFALFTDSACTQYATDPSGNYYGTEKEINGVLMHVLTTDANGKIQLGVLPVGTYYLKEVATQSGYILPESPIVITVTGTGVTATQGGRPLTVTPNSTNTLYTIVAVNSAGTALPHTGGTGTTPYTLGGIALILAAAMIYGLRMRRRERRSE